jgi:riboflavin synthase
MFSGIVEAVAEIKEARTKDGVRFMRIALPPRWKLKEGESVAVGGICTTVIGSAKRSFDVEYMPETIRKTTAGAWKAGTRVNLERSLKYGDRVSGQLLPGHVDGTAKVAKTEKDGASKLLTVTLPARLAKRVQLHGWVALDGVSLTVARKAGARATMALVPYTLKVTTLGKLAAGSLVNVETERATVSSHASSPSRRRP